MSKRFKLGKQKIFDFYLGNLLCRLHSPFKNKKLPSKIRKIIIYKIGAIGDSILFVPMVKLLKEKTGAKIVVVCSRENKEVFSGQKFVDKIILMDIQGRPWKLISSLRKIKAEGADLAIDGGQSASATVLFAHKTAKYTIGFRNLKTNGRNSLLSSGVNLNPNEHMAEVYFDLLRPLGISRPLKVKLSEIIYSKKDVKKVSKLLGNKKKIVGVHACCNIELKKWPLERYRQVIEEIIVKGYRVVLVGSPAEEDMNRMFRESFDEDYREKILNLSGKISIKELAALMKRLKFFLANDGGPMHVAASMGVPTIGLFGLETPVRYGPFNEKSTAIYKNSKCSPCIKAYAYEWPNCDCVSCMKLISVSDVKKKIKKSLS